MSKQLAEAIVTHMKKKSIEAVVLTNSCKGCGSPVPYGKHRCTECLGLLLLECKKDALEKLEKRVCTECRNPAMFKPRAFQQWTCSDECARIRDRRKARDRYLAKVKLKNDLDNSKGIIESKNEDGPSLVVTNGNGKSHKVAEAAAPIVVSAPVKTARVKQDRPSGGSLIDKTLRDVLNMTIRELMEFSDGRREAVGALAKVIVEVEKTR